MKNSKRGITLIALIVTVIIMIILASVTIKIMIDGGIIKKAQRASKQTIAEVQREELLLMMTTIKMDMLKNPNGYKFDEDGMALDGSGLYCEQVIPQTLQEAGFYIDERYMIKEDDIEYLDFEAVENNGLLNMTDEEVKIVLPCLCNNLQVDVIIGIDPDTMEIYYFEIDGLNENSKGKIKVSLVNNKKEITKNDYIAEITEDGVPIPVGFTYVEGNRKTGTVIKDDNNNEFVWVPVNTNPKLKISLEADKKIENIVVENISGPVATIPVNDDYVETLVDVDKNSTYQIAVNYKDGTTDYELYNVVSAYSDCYDLFPIITIKMYAKYFEMEDGSPVTEEFLYSTVQTAVKDTVGTELKTKIDVLRNLFLLDINENNAITEEALVAATIKAFTIALTCDKDSFERIVYTDEMAEKDSVLKYGGFYIARYEAGEDGTIRDVIYPKNNITYTDAKLAAESMYSNSTSVKSALPSGTAWDYLAGWIVESGAKKFENVYLNADWGNLKNKSSSSQLKTTGSSSSYEVNHIYDLLGNLRELTTRKIGEEYAARGEAYNSAIILNFNTIVTTNTLEADEADQYTGYRPILYLNVE